jgi:hypothetical protein
LRTTKRTVPAILLLFVLPPTAALAQTSDIPARKPVRLEGTVISERDHPLIGTSVLAQPAAEPSTFHLTSTDRKGNFRIDNVPEGRYRLEFRHEGFLPVVKEGVETRHPFRAVIEITMPRGQEPAAGGAGESEPGSTVKFSGRVTSGDGKAIPETKVRLVRTDAVQDPREALTGVDGAFEISDLSAGRYSADVLGAGYLPLHAVIDLRADARLQAVLTVQPTNYRPPALDLVPSEEPIPPAGFPAGL